LPNQNMLPGRPAKPPGMTKEVGAEWDRLIKDLASSGITIAKAHGRLIEQAAEIAVDLSDAAAASKTDGPYYLNRNTGAVMLHPATRRLDSLRRDYVKVLSLLGLRSAVAGETEKAGQSLDDYMDE
jgi:Phage terminase, small subunit